MIKAYAESRRHFVEVKLSNEELSDPLLIFKVLVMDEKIGFEYCVREYMIWLSDKSIYEYSKVCNVFELEAKNGYKAV